MGWRRLRNLTRQKSENHASPNTFYTYDPAGRLTRVEQTLTSAPGGRIATAYTYDIGGNLTAVTDPNGNTTTYLYDDFGQMLRQVSPVTGTTTYTYNVAGQLTASTDANGATTTRRYDALGRLLSIDSIRGSDREQVATPAIEWPRTSSPGTGPVSPPTPTSTTRPATSPASPIPWMPPTTASSATMISAG